MSAKYTKLIVFAILSMITTQFSIAQTNSSSALQVKHFRLQNGMEVFINPDQDAAYVSGMVGVKTGSKYDPSDATGIAHYLEHMLFKGTESLGTIDFDAELLFLDSISILYDSLTHVTEEDIRKEIHEEINRLSLEAGKYAIPNELDLVLDNMGSKGVNAFTGYEVNAYFNRFPENQLDKWLKLYAHRFEKPVFRLFQSELETVFEEKNMYMDQFEMALMEAFFAEFYKNHPYGQQSILGKAEHIKNPSLTQMKEFYDSYYVANNMALILSGPLNVNECMRLVEASFGQLPAGKVPEFTAPEEVPFMYHETVSERLTPIRAGLIGFRTVPIDHPDKAGLDVLHALLSNSNETGMLDRLGNENKMMYSLAFNDQRMDEGGSVFLYVPKILFQRMSKAEELVLAQVDSLKSGNFSEENLKSVKKTLVKENQQMFESVTNRSLLLLDAFIYGESWEETLDYPNQLLAVSSDDVVKLANKYYGDNYLLFRSRMGFPKKEKLKKPGYDPVKPENKDAKSAFTQRLEQIPAGQLNPDFITIGDEVRITDLTSAARFYYVENPVNEIFQIDLRFEKSRFENPLLNSLSLYMMQAGSEKYPELEYRRKLQALGASMSVNAGDRYFSISMTGFESDLDSSLYYLNQLLTELGQSESSLDRIVQLQKLERQYEKRKPDIKADALLDFAMYGDQSEYLNRLSKKELKDIGLYDLTLLLDGVVKSPVEIHYSGRLNESDVRKSLVASLKLPEVRESSQLYERELKQYDEPLVYFVDDKKAVQSQIYFYVKGEKDGMYDRPVVNAYNNYFGNGMASVVFQEIRELRSMAYTTWAHYFNGYTKEQSGYFNAFVGTQADKTIDAVSIMDSLIHHMPERSERMPVIINSLKQSINTDKPDFRNISYLVSRWMRQSYQHDPREYYFRVYDDLNFERMNAFAESRILNKPMVIVIVGRKKDIDMKALAEFGEIIELKEKDILN